MNLPYAYRVAASFDYNRDGFIKTGIIGRELEFDNDAKRRTDFNRDGKISIDEFAHALNRGDVFVGFDREVHSNNPFGQPGPQYPYPGGGSPYYPGQPGPITYPGSGFGGGYGGGYGYGGGAGYGNIVGGAAIGGAIGAIADGRNGLEKGAVIGGVLGAIANLFGGN